jgi:hypothetical protein
LEVLKRGRILRQRLARSQLKYLFQELITRICQHQIRSILSDRDPVRLRLQEQVLLLLRLLGSPCVLPHSDPSPFAALIPLDRVVAFRVDFDPTADRYIVCFDAARAALHDRAMPPCVLADLDVFAEVAAPCLDHGHPVHPSDGQRDRA